MAKQQSVTWTALPDTASATSARFSVCVTPRLTTGGGDLTLADFPDWLDWPSVITASSTTVSLSVAGYPTSFAATVRSAPDSARWKALFPATSPVRSFAYQGADNRRIWSYPTSWIIDYLSDRWGRFAATSPGGAPAYSDLVDSGGFADIGFESLGDLAETGPQRKARLQATLAGSLHTGSVNGAATGPADWAAQYAPPGSLTSDQYGLGFLSVEHFHTRGLPQVLASAPPPVSPPGLDFHQAVALTRDHPALQRLLGLVLDITVTDPAFLSLVNAATATNATVQATVSWTPQPSSGVTTYNVAASVNAVLGPSGLFAAAEKSGGDLADRMLALDGGAFQVVTVDPDAGALAARQFADNLTRSRCNGAKLSLLTPDTYDLPALRGHGVSVTRVSRAYQLAVSAAAMRSLDTGTFDSSGKPTDPSGSTPPVYAQDLTRGYRWDVWDFAAGAWFPLMRRTGRYLFPGSSDPGQLAYAWDDEATAIVSPTTSGKSGDTDLYLQESMLRWNGWSAAVQRAAIALDRNGEPVNPGTSVDPNFQLVTTASVPPGTLPRLRYGRMYQLRARAVDLAGNSKPAATGGQPVAADHATPPFVYRRHEPVPAPQVLGRSPQGSGETDRIVAIRSENGSSVTTATSVRHIAPPRTAVAVAEQHGAFDDPGTGHPVQASVYADLVTRDAAAPETDPACFPTPQPNAAPGSVVYYYDTDTLPVTWLPDVLCRSVVVQGLPPTAGPQPVDVGPGPWPRLSAFRLRLAPTGGAPAWAWDGANRVLTAALGVGDVFELLVSSGFTTPADSPAQAEALLGLLGLWDLAAQYAAKRGVAASALKTAHAAAVAGTHPMFSPPQRVLLVHAVRAPLMQPQFQMVAPRREHVGDTYAPVDTAVQISRKSTGRIDLIGYWTEPVDAGPGTAAPSTRSSVAVGFSFILPRTPGYIPSPDATTYTDTGRHEFGDTKYRRVTYQARVVSPFTEYFRETAPLSLTGANAPLPVAPVEPSTVKVTDTVSGTLYQPAVSPAGPGDYCVDPAGAALVLTPGSRIRPPASLQISCVRQPVSLATDPPASPLTHPSFAADVPSSARPAAPRLGYVLPTFRWTQSPGRSIRQGGGLRVYLERPWWSSGDGELLAVMCWQGPASGAIDGLDRLVTRWGEDPAHTSVGMAAAPAPSDFVNGAAVTGIGLPEAPPGTLFNLATYQPVYAAERDLWFVDVQVAPQRAYWPFLRLALARYQPNTAMNLSADLRLSKVVLADVVQISPTRVVALFGSGLTRTVQITGRTIARFQGQAGPGPTSMRITVETALPAVADPDLRWRDSGQSPVTVAGPQLSDQNMATWSAIVQLPADPASTQLRLVVEEIEAHPLGDGNGGTGERVVHVDTVPLPQ
jgi:hypothetical protein